MITSSSFHPFEFKAEELTILKSFIERVIEKKPVTLVILGPGGSGKSTLERLVIRNCGITRENCPRVATARDVHVIMRRLSKPAMIIWSDYRGEYKDGHYRSQDHTTFDRLWTYCMRHDIPIIMSSSLNLTIPASPHMKVVSLSFIQNPMTHFFE